MIDDCDYTQWHNFIFDTINGACPVDMIEEDKRKDVIDFLEIVSQYMTAKGEKLMPTNRKVAALIKDINQYGMMESRYFRIMISLLTISEELFDYALKGYTGNIDFIERAKFHIEKNILRNLTLDDVAAKSFVSACYLSRTFKKITGFGFSNYIATRKITIAKSLLRFSDLQVNTIALELAYQDSNYFCRIFKKDTGMTPLIIEKSCPRELHGDGVILHWPDNESKIVQHARKIVYAHLSGSYPKIGINFPNKWARFERLPVYLRIRCRRASR